MTMNSVKSTLNNAIKFFVSYIAAFIFRYVLGWKINNLEKIREQIDKSKTPNVAVYLHTGMYEPLLGFLVSLGYNIDMYSIIKKELTEIPLIGKAFNLLNHIPINRSGNLNIVDMISNEVKNMPPKSFLTISPEGTRKLTTKLKSGFYHIAKQTKTPIYVANFDFSDQTFDLYEVFNSTQVEILDYSKILKKIETDFANQMPHSPEKCFLTRNRKEQKPTTFISWERSILRFSPIIIIAIILGQNFLM